MSGVLGLPPSTRACLVDLDGVLTDTATVHAAAWAVALDEVLRAHGGRFVAFDPVGDYRALVDGRPRDEGTRTFLAARGITLPEGHADDDPGTGTVAAVGARKSEVVAELLRRDGVQAYPGSAAYLRAVRAAGLGCAVVSASTDARRVLVLAGLADLVQVCVDGVTAREQHLRGKPAPDGFLTAAAALGIPARWTAVFEDAVVGVRAGRAAGVGWVVGVDRGGAADGLTAAGADVVVADLADLLGPA